MELINLTLENGELEALQEKAGLNNKDFKTTAKRAIKKTITTLKKNISKKFRQEIKARNSSWLKRRLLVNKVRETEQGVTAGLWFGLNDLEVSELKGKPKKTKGGLIVQNKFYKNAFITYKKQRYTATKEEFKKQLFLVRQTENKYPTKNLKIAIKPIAYKIINAETNNNIETLLNKNLIHEIKYQISKAK